MWALRLTLLLALSYGCRGQSGFFFDISSQLRNNGTTLLSTSTNDRSICYDGTNVFYTSGGQILRRNDSAVQVDLADISVSSNIESLSCHCNIFAYSYQNGALRYLAYRPAGTDIEIVFNVGAKQRFGVEVTQDNGLIAVFSDAVWLYTYVPLEANRREYSYSTATGSLAGVPRCVSSYNTTTALYVFVTFSTLTNVQVIVIPHGTASGQSVAVNSVIVPQSTGAASAVACVDVADTFIYFLQTPSSAAQRNQWELRRFTVTNWLTGSGEAYGNGATSFSGTDGNLLADANGLEVCGSNCPATCDTASCTCTGTPVCGFCAGDDTTCQCADSALASCSYLSTSLATSCVAPTPQLNAYCVVEMPLADRRKGNPIRVFGVAFTNSNISVIRLSQTGRWNTNTLPIRSQISGNTATLWYNGFSANVPSSGRGRRFGNYAANIIPTDATLNDVIIPCICTESSGFYNQFYTYTVSSGGTVSLESTLRSNLQRFMGSLRWDFTGFDTNGDPVTPDTITQCNGQRICTMTSLTVANQGVYECYRPNRRKRTWHPIFYLFIRECPDGMFGPTCAGTCNSCVQGVCDELTGTCTCYPGWTGSNCDTTCAAGMVGQGCEVSCSNSPFSSAGCSGLSICIPGKGGCSCYSGLQAPRCTTACPAGMCGPSCRVTCFGGAATCDARTCL